MSKKKVVTWLPCEICEMQKRYEERKVVHNATEWIDVGGQEFYVCPTHAEHWNERGMLYIFEIAGDILEERSRRNGIEHKFPDWEYNEEAQAKEE